MRTKRGSFYFRYQNFLAQKDFQHLFSREMAREYDHLFKLLIIGDSGKNLFKYWDKLLSLRHVSCEKYLKFKDDSSFHFDLTALRSVFSCVKHCAI